MVNPVLVFGAQKWAIADLMSCNGAAAEKTVVR